LGGVVLVAGLRLCFVVGGDAIMALLKPVQEIDVLNPDGAFFIFCRCAGLLGKTRPDGQKIESEQDVMNYLLESGVSGVAGSAYGLSPYFRLSIATDIETVREAGRRIAQACAVLK
jgi:aspartate aminotransferase